MKRWTIHLGVAKGLVTKYRERGKGCYKTGVGGGGGGGGSSEVLPLLSPIKKKVQ